MEAIIAGAVGILLGIGLIVRAVYNRFFRSFVPNPKKWGRTSAKVIGRHHYQVKNLSKYGGPAYHDCFEKSIAYTVDGKTYKKYVDDNENGAVHIYYRIKNPNIIRTVSEVKAQKRECKSNSGFGFMIFIATVIILIFSGILVMGISKVTHTPIGNTYYV